MAFHNNIIAGASGAGGGTDYQISKSLRLNAADSSSLTKDYTGSSNTTFTLSFWIKRAKLGAWQYMWSQSDGSNICGVAWSPNDTISLYNGSHNYTTAVFRDVAAWYHICLKVSSGSATLYVNNAQVATASSFFFGGGNAQIGQYIGGGSYADNSYIADFQAIDGQALNPTDFAEYDSNNNWQPKKFNYGTTKHLGDWVGDTAGTPYGGAVNGSDKAFDGDDSTGAAPATSTAFVFTPSTPITGISKVRIRAVRDSSQSDDDGLQLNGTEIGSNWTAGAAVSEVEITVNNLTSLRWETNSISHWYKVYKIEIYYDGAYHALVPGDINSFHLDFSDNSSNAALGTDSSGFGTTLPGVDFDGTGDHLESADHADYSLGTNDFTIEFFLLPREFDNYQALVMKYAGGPSSSSWWISDNSAGGIYFYLYYNGSYELGILSSGATMNLNKWNHVACVRDGSTARIYINGVQAGTGNIGTVALNDSATALRIGEDSQGSYDLNGIMSNVRLINGTCLYPNGTTFTVPSTPLTNVTNTKLLCCQSSSSATAATVSPNTLTTSGDAFATSKQDTAWTVNNLQAAGSAWDQSQTWSSLGTGTPYNFAFDWDKAFNGIISTSTDVTFGASDATMTWTPSSPITVNTSVTLYVYNATNGSSYGTRVNGSYITGTNNYNVPVTLTAATLGGQLTSIQLTNSGLVGPYLGGVEVDGVLLVDSGVVDTAASGIDSLIDTPTNYTADSGNNGGNYCVFNPLRDDRSGYSEAPTNGNLETYPRGDFPGTIPVTSGKWYWEITITTVTNSGQAYMGVLDVEQLQKSGSRSWDTTQISAMQDTGDLYGAGKTGSGVSYAQGDILGFALDASTGKLWIAKNNTWINSGNPAGGTGHAFSGLSYSAYTLIASDSNTGNKYSLNAGQRPFNYTPPTNFLSICTTNLPDPTIADGSTAFDVLTWNGNDTQRNITGLSYSPDLVWIKQRSGNALHSLQDTVRGATKNLVPNDSQSEGTETAYLNAFLSNGFSIGTSSVVNDGSSTYVGWAWDAGSSNTSISAGGLNSSLYNQSQTWSNLVTGTLETSYGNSSATAPFDGDTGSNYPDGIRPLNGNYLSMNFGTTFANATSVKIYGFASLDGVTYPGSEENLKINGTAIGASDWVGSGQSSKTFSLSNGLTSLEWGYSSGSQSTGYLYLSGIEVDGKLLVDNNVTLDNVPTIASTQRANPSVGFSIVNASVAASLTGGPTLAHGLDKKPEFIIGKNREYSIYWYVYHKDLSDSHYLIPNNSAAQNNSGAVWGTHNSLDSNIFRIGTGTPASMWIPSGTHDCIFYVWTSVEGYSAFGKFSGNSSTDGPFVYCGFKPRFLLLKGITQARDWIILDTERDAGNVGDSYLHVNTAGAESTYAIADILSNGFKMRYNGGLANQTGEDYIWAAWASHPFRTARAR